MRAGRGFCRFVRNYDSLIRSFAAALAFSAKLACSHRSGLGYLARLRPIKRRSFMRDHLLNSAGPLRASTMRGEISRIANARIWTPPHCKLPSLWRPCRLHTYIRPLTWASLRCRAMMGYSRAGSQSLFRASRTWTFEGFASAGSTGLPSFRLLRNRG